MEGVLIYVKKKLALLAVVTAAFVVGGVTTNIVMASIPDSSGVIHGCYTTGSGSMRIIDSASASCTGLETALNWDQSGASNVYSNAVFTPTVSNETIIDVPLFTIPDIGYFNVYRCDESTAMGMVQYTNTTSHDVNLDGGIIHPNVSYSPSSISMISYKSGSNQKTVQLRSTVSPSPESAPYTDCYVALQALASK